VSKIDVLFNPGAAGGRASRLQSAVDDHLKTLGLDPTIHQTAGPGQGVNLALELIDKGCRTLVVAGGDGTLFEAINGCMQSEGPLPDLALIPLGSGNDFAKSLGIPLDWKDACDRILLGTKRRVDIGQCNDIFFCNSLGIGFDADVADIARRRKWLPGNFAYLAALAQALIRLRHPKLTISFDGGHVEQEVTLMIVANGSYEGGRFQFAPDADIEDGKLDLVITPKLSRREIIRLAPLVSAGEVREIDGYKQWQTRHASIHISEPSCIHADGEIIYRQARRLEIGVIPGAISFLS